MQLTSRSCPSPLLSIRPCPERSEGSTSSLSHLAVKLNLISKQQDNKARQWHFDNVLCLGLSITCACVYLLARNSPASYVSVSFKETDPAASLALVVAPQPKKVLNCIFQVGRPLWLPVEHEQEAQIGLQTDSLPNGYPASMQHHNELGLMALEIRKTNKSPPPPMKPALNPHPTLHMIRCPSRSWSFSARLMLSL